MNLRYRLQFAYYVPPPKNESWQIFGPSPFRRIPGLTRLASTSHGHHVLQSQVRWDTGVVSVPETATTL